MSIQKDYERSMRRLRDAVDRMEDLGYVVPRIVSDLLEKVKPPQEVPSRKYLVMLLLFSQTCETLGVCLTVREQLVVKLTILGRRHPTPDIQFKMRKLDNLVISQNKNIESHRLLLEYRGTVLDEILDGNDPSSRYT